MTERRTLHTDDGPVAVGASGKATTTEDLAFTAGRLAPTPDGEMLADATVGRRTELARSDIDALSTGAAVDIAAVAGN